MRIAAFFSLLALASSSAKEKRGKGPRGHLLPLGSHRPPSVLIEELTRANAPGPEEFFEKYVKHSKAAIFRNAITDSKAFDLWTDEYVRDHFGEMEVRLEGKHEKKHLPPIGEKYIGRDSLRHFVETYHGTDTYVVSDLPSAMYGDVGVLPSLGACGEMSRRIVEVNLWWSGGGTQSIIHKDAYNQINCLLNGTKYWKLIENKYEKDIYKHPEPEYELGGFSDVNPQEVDLIQHPDVARTEWSNFTIHAGDCLFLPKSYYHQVVSTGTHNLAVSLLFARFDGRDNLDFSDCTEHTDYRTPRPLTDFDVQLVWKGKGAMVMGRADLEDQIRAMLLNLTSDAEKGGKTADFETLTRELVDNAPPDVMQRMGELHKAFLVMDKNGDGAVTNREVKELTLDELRLISDEVDIYEPSATYKFEYSIIAFERVWTTLKKCLARYRVLDRETWIHHYLKLGGTEAFGDEVFSRLLGDKSEIASGRVTKGEIWFALENWAKFWAPQYSNLSKKPVEGEEAELREWANRKRNANDDDDSDAEVGQYETDVQTEAKESPASRARTEL